LANLNAISILLPTCKIRQVCQIPGKIRAAYQHPKHTPISPVSVSKLRAARESLGCANVNGKPISTETSVIPRTEPSPNTVLASERATLRPQSRQVHASRRRARVSSRHDEPNDRSRQRAQDRVLPLVRESAGERAPYVRSTRAHFSMQCASPRVDNVVLRHIKSLTKSLSCRRAGQSGWH
jgi:hypothetical protein